MSLFEVVTIVLIILKILNLIQVSWWFVFMPTIIGLLFPLILILILAAINYWGNKW